MNGARYVAVSNYTPSDKTCRTPRLPIKQKKALCFPNNHSTIIFSEAKETACEKRGDRLDW